MAEIVALVDYGAGNLHSVENALRQVGATVKVTADPDVLRAADRIVLPGVGSFRACAEGLRAEQGVIEAMHERVFVGGAPFLGICVGMQLMSARGLEKTVTNGLGWIAGNEDMLNRFLALTGIEAGQIRNAAAEPGFLAGVLVFLLAHEPSLMAFCNETGTDPDLVQHAREELLGNPGEEWLST